MNQFFLPLIISPSKHKINHSHALTFLGSCFSDEIGSQAKLSGFETVVNPLGTIFNPISLAQQVLNAINTSNEIAVLERDNNFYSWEASTKIVGVSHVEITNLILRKREQLRHHLSKSGLIIVTFGTAFVYKLDSTKVVANCHKKPGNLFQKELAGQTEIVSLWRSVLGVLNEFNPNLRILFTVSPVRHTRDGVIENTRSKARLIEVVSELITERNVGYFPSYEIVLDELRDYRFFKQDRVHPNEEAIDYVWKRFSEVYFTDETKSTINQIRQIRKRFSHQSETELKLDENTEWLLNGFKQNYPWILW